MSAQIWRECFDNSHLQTHFPQIFPPSIQSSPSEVLKDYEVKIFSVYTHYEYSKRYSSLWQQRQHNHGAFFWTKFKAALYIYRHRLLAAIFQCFLPLWFDSPSGSRPSHCWGFEIALRHRSRFQIFAVHFVLHTSTILLNSSNQLPGCYSSQGATTSFLTLSSWSDYTACCTFEKQCFDSR